MPKIVATITKELKAVGHLGLALMVPAVILAAGAAPVAHAAVPCPNAPFRVGPSAALPDCRAYELVTPRGTNGASPVAGQGAGEAFDTPLAAQGGNSFVYRIFATALSGSAGNGFGNNYRAIRSASGWASGLVGPTGEQAKAYDSFGFSSDHEYESIGVVDEKGGLLAIGGTPYDAYVRRPNGGFYLVGEGTLPAEPDLDGLPNGLADDLNSQVDWVNADGSHVIFHTGAYSGTTPVQLLPEAPPSGTQAIYDRTPAGLRLVSLLPGEITPPSGPEGEMHFEGASVDGSVVLFSATATGSPLLARVDGTKTETVASGSWTAAGVSEDGGRVFYLQGGDIYAFDTGSEVTTQVTSAGDAEVVNVSADGSHVYFLSQHQLDGSSGIEGFPNLYVWDGSTIHFIAVVEPDDVLREEGGFTLGLAAWALGEFSPAHNKNFLRETSRTTPDGSVFIFESRAKLGPYENEGHTEIYRYETGSPGPVCISCSPGEAPPESDASLAIVGNTSQLQFTAVNSNVTDDGQTVLFQTGDRLLAADSNSVDDVYEWRAGQISLISLGQGARASFLYGMTTDAHDVFFRTADRLVPQGQEAGVPAIYDARIDGGLASQQLAPAASCSGDACQGDLSEPPALSSAASAAFKGRGNVRHHRRCARHARRKVRGHRRHRCRHRQHKHRQGSHGRPAAQSALGRSR